MTHLRNIKIAIVGQGYVGLPLSLEFAKKFPVTGFDISDRRISEIKNLSDKTRQCTGEEIKAVITQAPPTDKGYFPTSRMEDISGCNVYIITVPTPVDGSRNPNLQPLSLASQMIASVLKKGDTVIYESTTYPGCTEDFCVPLLESCGLVLNRDFTVGYSPERISPGDHIHTVSNIKKVTSGSTPDSAEFVNALYAEIIAAGTYKAPSIKVAEAAKVIENAQRDINISFVNELALIFDRLNIDTQEVLDAAATKWNFVPYKPGLVGGHCIGVDPYYLAYISEKHGYQPNVILSGRRVNDQMGSFIAKKTIKMLIDKRAMIKDAQILLLGFTFKENCPDVRNTKVIDIYTELSDFGASVTVYDPWADPDEMLKQYNITPAGREELEQKSFDAVILAVAHDEFRSLDLKKLKAHNGIVYDCKGFFAPELVNGRL